MPLSPGAWAVFQGDNPMFTVGAKADSGTELIAEDASSPPSCRPPRSTAP